ncbi:transmembrane protein 116 [Mugil cephalus]|uniref:transmembrane protein 116 n=1 Tax=Mugil cephalus TaxID=48193 RepID=UPI001FB67075|nr:transmembrane protein 116 [Mugil cephalus]
MGTGHAMQLLDRMVITMVPSDLLTNHQIENIFYVYISLLTISAIGSLSVLVVSIVRWRHLRQQVHLLVQLALADLLASLVLIFSSAISKRFAICQWICQYTLPLSLTFYFISFLLVVVYAWKSKNAIQGWRERPADDEGGQCGRRISPMSIYLIVWFFPFAIFFSYAVMNLIHTSSVPEIFISGGNTTYCTNCFLFLDVPKLPPSAKEKLYCILIRAFLVIVVISVMLSCSVIYYKVGKWYKQRVHGGYVPVEGDSLSRKRFKSAFSTARDMVMVILICWTPALVLIVLTTLVMSNQIEQRHLYFLYLIQAACLSLQGFLNSVVYAWRRPNFREPVFGENTPLLQRNRAPFFEESLRTSF